MLRATVKYGALRTKVLSMYGQLLNEKDFEELCNCRNLDEVCANLKSKGGWDEYLRKVSASPSKEEFKSALRKRTLAEYERLYKFSYFQDRLCLRSLTFRRDYERIKYTLRRLSGLKGGNDPLLWDDCGVKSSLDMVALQNCEDYSGLIAAAKGSVFEKTLRSLPVSTETGLPVFGDACVLLESRYFSESFALSTKKGKGFDKEKQCELIGFEADMLNIINLIRLQRYIPSSLDNAESLLLPVKSKLRPSVMKKLLACRSEDELRNEVGKTAYGKYFTDKNKFDPEKAYRKALVSFARKLVKMPQPGLYTAQAYLVLREQECGTIQRIAEAVCCGADPKSAL